MLLESTRADTQPTINSIAEQLYRLHANNCSVIPQMGKAKQVFPMREPCGACPPGWRDTGEWDEKHGRFRRIPPQRAHAQDEAATARDAAVAAGADAAEARKVFAQTEERVLRSHDVPDRFELWAWHVAGEDSSGEWFHRGVYSHRDQDAGLDVCWDLDKGHRPKWKARLISEKLAELGLSVSSYANSSFGGAGIHVRLCLDDLTPSWLRKTFGRKLLESVGLKPGNDPGRGETESFPKQDEADYCGNMIGLPCSIPRMAEGATCVLDTHGLPMADLEWTEARLASVRQATQAEFFAACQALGFDPVARPIPPAPKPVRPLGAPFTIPGQRGPVTITRGLDQLTVEVRRRYPIAHLLAQLGRPSKGGDKYCCPIHEADTIATSASATAGAPVRIPARARWDRGTTAT